MLQRLLAFLKAKYLLETKHCLSGCDHLIIGWCWCINWQHRWLDECRITWLLESEVLWQATIRIKFVLWL